MVQKIPFYTKLAHVLICLISLVYIAIEGQTIIAPIIFSLLFSFLLLPFVGFMERRCKFPRLLSSFVALLSLILVIFSIIYLLGTQITDLAQDWPAFQQQILDVVQQLQKWIEKTFKIDTTDQVSYLSQGALKAFSTGTSIIGFTLLSLSSLLIFFVLIFLYTFFILLHRRLLLRFIVAVFPEKYSITVYEIASEVEYIVKRYIFGIFIQMSIVTILACVGFAIIGIKYGFLLGLITGIFNVIPYIGILTAFLLAAIVTFATASFTHVLLIVVVLGTIHIVDGNFIMPKIVGSKVRINTLIALLGLVIGEMIWGITGMLLSIPVIAVIKVIFDHVDGLKPWGMLLGDDKSEPDSKTALAEVIEDEERLEENE
jgi:predicted PurR-regulated permease PerM